MTLNDQRRLFIFGRAVIGILRRIEETMRGEPALSRKLDRARHRKVARIKLEIVRLAQNVKRACSHVKFHDRGHVCRRAAAKHSRAVWSRHKRDISIWTIDVRYFAGLYIDRRERGDALIDVTTDDRFGRSESIRRHAEDPLRHAQLGFVLVNIFDAAIWRDSFEVPPATAVRSEVQNAATRPFRLKNRLRRSPRDPSRGSQFAVFAKLADPQLAAVPWHIRMVPREPGQLRPLRTQARSRIKIIPLEKDHAVFVTGLRKNTDYRVDCFGARARMVLANTDETTTRVVHARVCVTHLAGRC